MTSSSSISSSDSVIYDEKVGSWSMDGESLTMVWIQGLVRKLVDSDTILASEEGEIGSNISIRGVSKVPGGGGDWIKEGLYIQVLGEILGSTLISVRALKIVDLTEQSVLRSFWPLERIELSKFPLSSSSSDDEEDTLNVFSESFDPLAVIYNPGLKKVPDPSAPVLDNVDKFVSVVEKKRTNHKPQKVKQEEPSTSFERNFKPEQMPIQGKPRKDGPNVWQFMDKVKGPLSLLKKAREEQLRIRVYTRGVNYLRGFMTGYLLAFDKHWNLALIDVDEVFKKRRFPKKPRPKDTEFDNETNMKIIKTNRRWIHCERHMDEATVLKGLIDKIRDARENLKLFKDETDDIDSCPQNKKSKINNAYEKSAMIVAKETELLGSSVVEELPGDDGAQYFLAIAGMQKNIQNLRELKTNE
ncbi:unnamed protein product [Lepeophtheirus salmonis]|uniref:(salmon louse) hypothetical protein n=1 Tax=Lepeophtheirus salmonis TaxID=72036 RepID=A0A7R8CCQ7_LEPSM|nr:unnamed protein product [Lepeophtheirus salmonis]CAF2766044.1 unnamed protein product [Lepeophtheirus salmonis]